MDNLVQSAGLIPSELESILCGYLSNRSVELLTKLDYRDAQSSQLILEILRFQSCLVRVYGGPYSKLLSSLLASSSLSQDKIQHIVQGLEAQKPDEVRRFLRSLSGSI